MRPLLLASLLLPAAPFVVPLMPAPLPPARCSGARMVDPAEVATQAPMVAEAATTSGALVRRAPGAVARTRARRAMAEEGEHITADIAVVVTDIGANLGSVDGRVRCDGGPD